MLFLTLASACAGAISLAGQAQGLLGSHLLARFHARARKMEAVLTRRENERRNESQTQKNTVGDSSSPEKMTWPAVTLLKPMHGDEPMLEQALETCFRQDYPDYEIVFGLHSADDDALPVIERLRARYPAQRVAVVIDSTEHGVNRKVGNLINMFPACQNDVFVIADSDIHAKPTYLRAIVDTLQESGVGLVTTLYAGRPADSRLVRQLGAHSINNNFLPGVMMSRLLGRQDCLGATMGLERKMLERIGGFSALVSHVADDAVLGQKVRALGQSVALVPTLCHTTVGEERLGALLGHELRWGRTVRSLEPVGYAFSSLQLPLFWATVCLALAPAAWGAWAVFGLGWLTRGIVSTRVARLTDCHLPGMFPFLVVRDWLSAIIMIGSACGSRVAWRGRTVHLAPPPSPPERSRPPLSGVDAGPPEISSADAPPAIDKAGINRSVRS